MAEFTKPSSVLIVCLAIGVITQAGISLAQENDYGTTQALSTLLDEFLAGASINDRATHEAFWDEDLIYTSSSGERFGKTAILAGLDGNADTEDPLTQYSAGDVEVRDYGELAVVTFRLLAHQDDALIDQYFNTGVFRQGDQGWQAVTWHATRIPSNADSGNADTSDAEN